MIEEKNIKKLKPGVKEKDRIIKRQRDELLSLQSVSQYLISETNLEDLLTKIATHVGKYLGAKFVTFWLLEENKKFLYVKAAYGMSPVHIKYSREEGHLSIDEAWIGRAVRDQKPYFSKDMSKGSDLPKRWTEKVKKLNLRGLICLPIVVANESVGGLCVYWTEPHKFEKFEIRLLSIVANQAAIAIKDIQTYQELQGGIEELKKTRLALVNMLEDTDEAKRKSEEEKNKTLAIITNFTDGLLFFDKENNLSLINPQAEDFFDMKGRDIIGRSALQLNTFPTISPLVKLLGGEVKDVFRKELKLKKSLFLEVSTVPIISGKEKLGALVILHDVSREKLIEEMKTEFVSLAAHQLRTPLSAIKWTLKMLLDEDLGKITENQRDFIQKTYISNERMIALINDLLDVARIEEGRYLYKPQPSQMENIVQFIINSYLEEIKKKKIRFEFKKPEKKLPKVMVDIEKIRLAIQNLFDNAIKYTPSGGRLTAALKYGKNEIEFQIQDSGVGIPEEQQERVFTKFFRAANVTRMETEGSGLGLFITKNIIEAHGGKIWFESKEKKGTTFYFTIPVKKEFTEFLKKI